MMIFLKNERCTSLKARLRNREMTIGSWITIGHPVIAEIMASAGFDWLTVDMEHSAITLVQAQQLIQIIELAGCIPLVRVGANDPNLIKRVMDAGSHGVIVPNINSRKEAEQAVRSVKYPPKGSRGVGLARAQGFGTEFEAYKEWNDKESIVIVQIEHIDAVNDIDNILAVEGVDAFMVGPYDLSGSLGIPGQFENPEFLAAMKKVSDAMTRIHGVAPGFHVVPPDVDLLDTKIREGYTFLAYSLDILFLSENCRRDLKQIKKKDFQLPRYIKDMKR
jgi:2-keto-3-deoxy-L-rhamnonate aldolase RhmA